jgi:two-component system response regulator HydG
LNAKVLIVEDNFIEAYSLERTLAAAGYHVYPIAGSVREALDVIEKNTVDLVLLDIFLKGDRTGIDLAHLLNKKKIAFVYLSANSNRSVLDKAKETRPYGFLVKPFRKTDVLVALDVAWYLHSHSNLTRSIAPSQSSSVAQSSPFVQSPSSAQSPAIPRTSSIIGASDAVNLLHEQIRIAAASNISVLIQGETGTGKELVARTLHKLSNRRDKPFIVVNCGGMPPTLIEAELFGHEKGAFTGAQSKRTGKFEQADGGTIFLDEIGELPIGVQSKFLRVLQEKEVEPIGGRLKKVDVRVIAATNRDLEEQVANGGFRIDLFYRLSVFPIRVPPLRERKPDIPMLAGHFIRQYAKESGKNMNAISQTALKTLLQYEWPGNIRELENVIFRSVLLNQGPVIEELSFNIPRAVERSDTYITIAENERNHILKMLEHCAWKVAGKDGAASKLNIKVSTLNSRMKKLGIKRPK